MYRNTAQAAEAEIALDDRNEYIIARLSAGTCGECGSHDGMRPFDREAVNWLFYWGSSMPPVFWCWHADPHHLYTICPICNPDKVVPDGYEQMNRAQTNIWLGTPCDCAACLLDRGEIPITGGGRA